MDEKRHDMEVRNGLDDTGMVVRAADLTRREFIRRVTEAGFGLFALAQVGVTTLGLARRLAHAGGRERLTLFVWSGLNLPVVAHEVARFYMRTHPGVQIDVMEGQNFEVYPKMVSARKLTPNQPLVHFGYSNTQFTYQGDVDDMWESIDPANVPNLRNIVPDFYRPQHRGVGFSIAPVGLMYNTRLVKEPPASWTDMWHPRFKGKLTSIKYAWYANGLVIAARLNGGSERNIEPGFRLWAEHADQFVAFANSNIEIRDLVIRGDAHLAAMFGGNVLTWKNEGAPVDFVIPREGMISFPLFLVIVKGVTPAQKRIAEEVINLILSDRWLARWAALTLFVPTTRHQVAPPSLRALPMYDPKEIARAINLDWATIAANDALWRERWDKEVVARMRR
ncbi:MAG: extracellular solute-binding protein [Armatimonadota bacterium]|nr:extracellular solute-binding protein [Armatimonadota bacterium]MDR7471476.1 extracellular solute-binding protein [Armatimonadota bacterium]MDR7506573.1 extracellular solute-binding protein [Armatimonadota bacterium]MDR7509909.1 extracellular solute-binding protein [Armatimonadota bacterium]MDR7516380.1 extracellular solute-binding protein [Armatimonadota bacterium]